jgi:Asp-tRNA(Asn)/Glu-tRNA(Gln) amidotransferase A subunit family amidase
MSVKGMTNTVGYTKLGKKRYNFDCEFVRVMREKGDIPFVHSSVPQAMMTYDSRTFLWGLCNNAWNSKKIAGGSSGGEGGLVCSFSSP